MTTPRFSTTLRLLGLLTLVCLAAGCARSREAPSLELQTRITDSNLKLFELDFPPQAHPASAPASQRNRQRRPKANPQQEQKIRQKILDEVIVHSGYCREGYVLLGRYAGETTRRVRGECRDRATEEDRHRFPDTVQRW